MIKLEPGTRVTIKDDVENFGLIAGTQQVIEANIDNYDSLPTYKLIGHAGIWQNQDFVEFEQPDGPSEYILCAAVNYDGAIVCGHRHSDCNEIIETLTNDMAPGREHQGFLTSQNRFVTREQAWTIAHANKQVIGPNKNSKDPNGILTSEDLY